MGPRMIYDWDNNKIIVDGLVFDGPESEADFPAILQRIAEALAKRDQDQKTASKKKDGSDGKGDGSSSSAPGAKVV